jgi:glucoamylase
MESLESWVERQYRHAAAGMLRSVSPLGLVHSRPGFGQTVAAKRGAIVASPVLGTYDPLPDYFFHWYRDSAIVIDALRRLLEAGLEPRALKHFADFVRFSLALRDLDGRTLAASPEWRSRVRADFRSFLRSDKELAAVHGEAVAGETRVNPDGTIDISTWGRPQYDGPSLRALAVLGWIRGGRLDAELTHAASVLLHADLAFTLKHAFEPCFDIWEEERGLHYYTLRTAAAALEEGAEWLDGREERHEAEACRGAAAGLLARLDEYWLPDEGFYRSRMLPGESRSSKDLDVAVILAALHSGGRGPSHSVHDPRIHATLGRLEALFDAEYPINQGRPPGRAPAMGRYAGDRYYSGGAYYFSTLAAAELSFRAAAAADEPRARPLCRQGDAFLETVRAFTPPSGDLSEQFDRRTGEQTSARHLAWSYAALISCIDARRGAEGAALHARERHG